MDIPQFHGLIAAGRRQGLAIGGKDEILDPRCVCRRDWQLPTRSHVPEFDYSCVIATGQNLPLGRKPHSDYLAGMSSELRAQIPRGDMPQPHGLVLTGGRDGLAIRRKHRPVDITVVPGQSPWRLPRGRIPEDGTLLLTGACQQLAVGGKCDAVYLTLVPLQGSHRLQASLAQAVKVMPFKAAQVFLIRLGKMTEQDVTRRRKLAPFPELAGKSY